MVVIERAPNFSLALQMIIVARPVLLKCIKINVSNAVHNNYRIVEGSSFHSATIFGKGSSIKNVTQHLLSLDCKLHRQQTKALVDHSALLCILISISLLYM